MKIIGLMITYNEIYYLKYSLPILLSLVDKIFVLDKSNDGTKEYLKSFDNVIVYNEEDHPELVSLLSKRDFIYNKGVEHDGTHFFFIDPDEIPSSILIKNFNNIITHMKPGDLIAFHWYNIMNDKFDYVIYDSFPYFPMLIYPTILHKYKEDRTIVNSHAHENRLPTVHGLGWNNCRIINCDYPILHFGRYDSSYMEWKQVQSMIGEYIHGQNISYINLYYVSHDILYDIPVEKLNLGLLPSTITHDIFNRESKMSIYNSPILELIRSENISNDILYKLDIFRNNSIIEFFKHNIIDFEFNKIRYKRANIYSVGHMIHLLVDDILLYNAVFVKLKILGWITCLR